MASRCLVHSRRMLPSQVFAVDGPLAKTAVKGCAGSTERQPTSKAIPPPMLALCGARTAPSPQKPAQVLQRRAAAWSAWISAWRGPGAEAENTQLAVVQEHMLNKAEDWNLSMLDIEAGAQLMRSDRQSLPTELDERGTILLFLYAKGVLRQEVSEARKAKLAALLLPDDIYEESKQRLRRLVLEGEHSQSVLDDSNSFTRLLNLLPSWRDNLSYVAFRDDGRISCGLLERVQLSGLCYMHAPVVLQAYLVAMQATGTSKMLDLADYIRKYRTAKELEDHIFRDEGGSSQAFLREILSNSSGVVDFSCRSLVDEIVGQAIIKRIVSNLKEFGPALVSGFMVTENFLDAKIHQYFGQDNSNEVGLHAMVLVGHRKDGGQDRFLLQNWWSDKGFIEVDAEYLAGQRASLVFVQSDQPDIPVQFSRSSARHVELEMTVRERLPMEM
ncbi:unnamed protein product [Symbiodinium sp. CCMP2592]|nr:unnamed protein product [Symbiodinium sp. CCMP2592]